MEEKIIQTLIEEIKKIAETKTDTDFIKQQINLMHKNLEGSFSNVAQGHNELYRMIQILTHTLVSKGVITQEELALASKEIAEQAAKEINAEMQRQKSSPAGLVTADG